MRKQTIRFGRSKLTNPLVNPLSRAIGVAMALSSGSVYAQLEEIVVTATKRAESAQTIPLSISAVSGEELEARGAIEFFDYATTIPNLSFGAATDGVLSGRSISLRGISGANTTGVYIDDTPISETIDPRILDLERIEVLRGPTGTLFGARSLGGTIRQITRLPDFDGTHGKLRLGLSDTDESGDLNFNVYGDVNVTFSDTIAGKFSLLFEDRGGVFDRVVGSIPDHVGAPASLGGNAPTAVIKDVDSQETTAVQAQLLFTPTENLTIRPRIMYQKTELDGFPLADGNSENFNQVRDFDIDEGGEDEWTLTSLNISYDTQIGTFTSATSYFDRETFETEATGSFINFLQALPGEAGGFGLFGVIGVQPVASPIFQKLEFESLVQEIRFTSDLQGRVNFVAGGFYQDTDDNEFFEPRNFAGGLENNFAQLQTALEIPGPLSDIWPFGDLVFTSQRPSSIEETGIFGEVNFDVTDSLSVVVGARWYDTEVNFSQRQAGLAAGVPLANDQSILTIPADFGSQSEDGTIFKASVEYQATDDVFVYGSIAEGFRLGGANVPIPDTLGCPDDLAEIGLQNTDTSQFQSDDLTSYELGIKADVSDSTRINAAVFFIDFEGIQQQVQLACGFGLTGNFGAAESTGIEVEVSSQLTDNIFVTGNIGYTDAEFTETVGAINTAGDPLQFVPELTASASIDYVSGGAVYRDMEFFARADLAYVDDSLSLVNSIPRTRDSYEQVGLRLGLRNDTYGVTFFIRNLTDNIANLADNRSIAAETPGRPRFVVSRPRTIGLEFNMGF